MNGKHENIWYTVCAICSSESSRNFSLNQTHDSLNFHRYSLPGNHALLTSGDETCLPYRQQRVHLPPCRWWASEVFCACIYILMRRMGGDSLRSANHRAGKMTQCIAQSSLPLGDALSRSHSCFRTWEMEPLGDFIALRHISLCLCWWGCVM